MKKVIVKASMFLFFALSLCIFQSCDKEKRSSNINSKSSNSSRFSNPNLTTALSSAIAFEEPDNIQVSKNLANVFNLKSLILSAGSYDISFADNPYGRVAIPIQFMEVLNSSNEIPGVGIRIRIGIAKIKTKKHPGCTCCAGIGFRCAFSSLTEADINIGDIAYSGGNIVDGVVAIKNNCLTIDFNDVIDWTSLNED